MQRHCSQVTYKANINYKQVYVKNINKNYEKNREIPCLQSDNREN